MKILSIKLLVGLSNILIYITSILLFLAFGFTIYNLPHETISGVSFALFSISVVLFITYQIIRRKEQKSTEFQLLSKHIIFNRVFYAIQYTSFIVIFLNIMLLRYHVIAGTHNAPIEATKIYFYVTFPIIFIFTNFGSILESIIRVEEKIFLNKKAWQKSANEAKNIKKSDIPLSSNIIINKNENPFSEPIKDVKKLSKQNKEQK